MRQRANRDYTLYSTPSKSSFSVNGPSRVCLFVWLSWHSIISPFLHYLERFRWNKTKAREIHLYIQISTLTVFKFLLYFHFFLQLFAIYIEFWMRKKNKFIDIISWGNMLGTEWGELDSNCLWRILLFKSLNAMEITFSKTEMNARKNLEKKKIIQFHIETDSATLFSELNLNY